LARLFLIEILAILYIVELVLILNTQTCSWNTVHWELSNNQSVTTYICIIFLNNDDFLYFLGDSRGHDCMVVGFTTTYAINAYHH